MENNFLAETYVKMITETLNEGKITHDFSKDQFGDFNPSLKKGDEVVLKHLEVDDMNSAQYMAAMKKEFGSAATVKVARVDNQNFGTLSFIVNDPSKVKSVLSDQGIINESDEDEGDLIEAIKKWTGPTGEEKRPPFGSKKLKSGDGYVWDYSNLRRIPKGPFRDEFEAITDQVEKLISKRFPSISLFRVLGYPEGKLSVEFASNYSAIKVTRLSNGQYEVGVGFSKTGYKDRMKGTNYIELLKKMIPEK